MGLIESSGIGFPEEGLRSLWPEKSLGKFYTPTSLADTIAEWAVRTGDEVILEPSVGGGALVDALIRRSETIKQSQNLRIFGCDIDENAIVAIRRNWPYRHVFETCDFLQLDHNSYPPVDVVVANPPFTRNHDIPPTYREALRRTFDVTGAPGLWVYFLKHSLRFLKPGGRLVFIVPAAAGFTDYSQSLIDDLRKVFSKIGLFRCDAVPAWHLPADERGSILVAENYMLGCSPNLSSGIWPYWVPSVDKGDMSEAYNQAYANCVSLGTLASVSIGAVTGRNKVFLLSERDRVEAGIARYDVRPIVSRARHAAGIALFHNDLATLAECGEKTLLLSPRGMSPPIERYLAQISVEDRKMVVWFNKRHPWWRVDPGPDCQAILNYMSHDFPKVAVVQRGIVSTNTLHRVRFLDSENPLVPRMLAVSSVSTFGQLAAEELGRSYGGGVLKLELKEARKIPIPNTPVEITDSEFFAIDQCLRRKELVQARRLADELLAPTLLGNNWRRAVEVMEKELGRKRMMRQRTSKR